MLLALYQLAFSAMFFWKQVKALKAAVNQNKHEAATLI
jgi:hypothetical protein